MWGCFGRWWSRNDARGLPERAFPFETAYSGLSRFMTELDDIYEGRNNYQLELYDDRYILRARRDLTEDEIRRIHKNVYKHYKVPGQRG